ncbi:DUF58 domain-containing protein [Xylophilus sp. GW821-FHT01B05]
MKSVPPETPAAPHARNVEALLRRLEWTALRRLDGLLQGNYRTLKRGAGLDLADLREYQPHDDVRHIDWNVTARTQVPHVRVFTEDREMATWFVVDQSASVDFGSSARRKRTVQAEFVGTIARLLTRHGNRVGALLGGSGAERWIPARGGRAHVLHLLQCCLQAAPASGPVAPTSLGPWLETLGRALRQRGTVFVVSDFISAPGWEKPLGRLAERHDVVAVRLFDPLELALPDIGLVAMRDAETGEQLLVDTHDRLFRQRFARIAAAREEALRASLATAGVDALELSTEDDLVAAVIRFSELRRRRSRQRGAPATRAA